MKKYILLISLVLLYSGVSCYLFLSNNELKDKNKTLYKQFKKNQLVDVDGEINLSEIESKNKDLEVEIKKLFYQDNYNYYLYLEKIKEKEDNNISVSEKNSKLVNKITSLESKVLELESQYNVLNTKYNSLKKQQSYSINSSNSYNFPLINQYPKYQSGCESVALTMLLRYYGINISPDSVISNLAKESLPYYENNTRFGGNPEMGFVGNPYTSASYGVYERPIGEVANMYKSGIQIRNNYSFQEVLNLVNSGHPVLVWTSMGLSIPYISDSWVYKPTMEKISWKANEHAVVVISVQGNNVVIADPMGGQIKSYSISLFESRYNYYGRKALYYL